MQISCIQEHLGVFRSLVSSPLCSAPPPLPRFPFHPPNTPSPPPLSKSDFLTSFPSLFCFRPLSFLPPKPSSASIYILAFTSRPFFPMPTLLPPVLFLASLPALFFVSVCRGLFGRMPLLFPRIWFIQRTMRRFVKSLSVALSSGGGFKLQAVYLDILIGVNNFFFPSFPTHAAAQCLSGNASFYVCRNIIRRQLMLTVAVVMALFAERCHGTTLITAVLFADCKRQ